MFNLIVCMEKLKQSGKYAALKPIHCLGRHNYGIPMAQLTSVLVHLLTIDFIMCCTSQCTKGYASMGPVTRITGSFVNTLLRFFKCFMKEMVPKCGSLVVGWFFYHQFADHVCICI